jgi:DMSO/TMAO reductase YedYZ molybdopterin-dependent catalytic subunit
MTGVLQRVGDPGDSHDFELNDDWQLTLKCGSQAKTFTLAELKALGESSQEVKVNCVSSGKIYSVQQGDRTVKGAPVTFTGIRFADLIRFLDVPEAALSVIFRSKAPAWGGPKNEKHTTSLEWSYCKDAPDLLLTWAMNGEPLPKKNGGPLRTTVGGDRYFYKSMKWIEEIEVSTLPMDQVRGTWETYGGYHNLGRTEFKEKFEPMMRVIERVDEEGVDHTRLLSREAWQETFEQFYADKDLSRLVVARMHEMGIDLKRDFRGVRFVNGDVVAKIRGTFFTKVDFAGCDFRGVNFSLARFIHCRFCDEGETVANLSNCDFEGTRFWDSDLRNVVMRNAYLSGAEFYREKYVASGQRPDNPALVQGLDLRGAQVLDPIQAGWLREDGAILDLK